RAPTGKLPARTETRRRAVFLSASLADAGFLGISDGVHGPQPVDGHLSGALQPVSGRSRFETPHGRESLGVPRRWRNGRTRVAWRDHAGFAREAGQFDFCRELQLTAP